MWDRKRLCPVGYAGGLDFRLRKHIQNPQKILGDYVSEGMVVLDVGCGPGFFSVELARMVGVSGRVIAADLQEGMLLKLKKKIDGNGLKKRIVLHRCDAERIGVAEEVDFVLAFYMVHEVADQHSFFREIRSILAPEGKFLLSEPKVHVREKEFEQTVGHAVSAGLRPLRRTDSFMSRTIVFQNDAGGPPSTSST